MNETQRIQGLSSYCPSGLKNVVLVLSTNSAHSRVGALLGLPTAGGDLLLSSLLLRLTG